MLASGPLSIIGAIGQLVAQVSQLVQLASDSDQLTDFEIEQEIKRITTQANFDDRDEWAILSKGKP